MRGAAKSSALHICLAILHLRVVYDLCAQAMCPILCPGFSCEVYINPRTACIVVLLRRRSCAAGAIAVRASLGGRSASGAALAAAPAPPFATNPLIHISQQHPGGSTSLAARKDAVPTARAHAGTYVPTFERRSFGQFAAHLGAHGLVGASGHDAACRAASGTGRLDGRRQGAAIRK